MNKYADGTIELEGDATALEVFSHRPGMVEVLVVTEWNAVTEWLHFTPSEAVAFADLLRSSAERARGNEG